MLDLTPEQRKALADSLLQEAADEEKYNRLRFYRPYDKQRAFHDAGATHRERLLRAANQSGKTYSGGMEMAIHLTGRYPDWWTGRRFDKPIQAWAAGVTNAAARDVLMPILLGPPGEQGSGAIPRDAIIDIVAGRGIPGLADHILVRHATGGISRLGLKSYAEGREKFQGASLDLLWLDEECDADIYMEALTRTNATNGMLYMTFTPLRGVSEVVRRFLHERSPDRCDVAMVLDEALHISAEKREQIIKSYRAHELEARTKGVPVLGSGRIFPVAESLIVCDPIAIPDYWARIGGLDFGWNHPAAAVELAIDRDHDKIYVVRSFRAKEQTPVTFASAIRGWGRDLEFAWPHDGHAETMSGAGISLAEQFRQQGIRMLYEHAQDEQGRNAVWSGLVEMLDYMQSGRFFVFKGQNDWLEEFRLYHHKDGKVVKLGDDLMAATRYAFISRRHARSAREWKGMRRPLHVPAIEYYESPRRRWS
jgi:phage terminase large subunit-like protein